MKKVIIALLVIATLFTFVSCKDELDKWYKLQPLDTTTEKGSVIAETINELLSSSGSVKMTSMEKTYKFNSDDGHGTVTITSPIDDKNGTISFKGEYGTVTSFECEYSGDFEYFYTADNGTSETALDSGEEEFVEELLEDVICVTGMCVPMFGDAYEGESSATYKSTESFYAGENYEYTITEVTIEAEGKGYNTKDSFIDDILSPLMLGSNDTVYNLTIKYKDSTSADAKEKTLKAKVSGVYNMQACSIIFTVTLDGHTYGLPLMSFL